MSKNKDIDEYCCPVSNRHDQDLMDTANWIGRGTDAIAERKAQSDKLFRDDKED
jgi:hypothetical protein